MGSCVIISTDSVYITLPQGSMYPNSIYFGAKVPTLRPKYMPVGTWTLRASY